MSGEEDIPKVSVTVYRGWSMSGEEDIPKVSVTVEIPVLSDRVDLDTVAPPTAQPADEAVTADTSTEAMIHAALEIEAPFIIDELLAELMPRLEERLRERLKIRAGEILRANLK